MLKNIFEIKSIIFISKGLLSLVKQSKEKRSLVMISFKIDYDFLSVLFEKLPVEEDIDEGMES